MINSTGAPPIGPVDIVIEKNIISKVQNVGYPGVPINENEGLNCLKMELKLIVKEAIYFLDLLILMGILEEDHKGLVLIMFLNYGWPWNYNNKRARRLFKS